MTDRLILAFDTSAAHCAAALLRGETVLASTAEEMTRGQAERLMPVMETLMAEAGINWPQLNAIGVGIGPGNFTGIRIAVSAARGLALALDIPAIGVDSFDIALNGATGAATVPAPRGQVYLRESDDAAPYLVAETDAPDARTLPAPQEMAERIARITAQRLPHDGTPPAPLYVRAADAAPPRDTAPEVVE
ncbi:tRNA threonylcarbamoyl adenosine modification protein YeaZ [Poseidonocella pacifica]|uniref:tRNA threonylcarbamoyl adenosine modification protein YeaZ n=1 Tax=Poseidonocella pacifica TaxID=871651 RepID=A0A1I0YYX1_9RHOB|nr:tRNA (adenosine(37)-N6)-threonylcarbamoyltransferase complex dimerization subunit type 1 TsaB [Poseidonocella pacifica]SFB18056.1 tRNA threonylcarbamoyl adenosine modification protein YeaZ [Poseidonocella pacifica]